MEDPAAPRSDGVLFLVVGPLTRLSDRSALSCGADRRLVPDDASGTFASVGQAPFAASAAGRRTRIKRIARRSVAIVLVRSAARAMASVSTAHKTPRPSDVLRLSD
jgi:hypothetical protein